MKMLTCPVGWEQALSEVFEQPYMQDLDRFLQAQKAQQKVIYPQCSDWFKAFEVTPLDKVRVVILGQDPYHQPGQAHGLCFSVQSGVKIPPSLVNIYKELKADLGIEPAKHGCLASWAAQGVLLLNSVLTVEKNSAGAHQNQGWELFTDQVIRVINERCENIVFLLWGGYAHKKGACINTHRHLVLTAAHPSPLSSYRGFFGCKHFSQTNDYLRLHGRSVIEWTLPDQSL